MVFTLLETANKHFSNEFIIQQARLLEEHETGIGKALYAAIPTVLSGIIIQVTGGGRQLTRQLLEQSTPPGGENLLDQLFHKQLGEVTRAVIHHAGIRSPSAYHILVAAAPAVFVTIREHAGAQHMDAAQLVYFLHSLTPDLASTLPADMPTVTAIPDEVADIPVVPPVYTAPEAPATTPVFSTEIPVTSKPQVVDEPEPEPTAEETQLPDENEPEEEEALPEPRKRRHWITLTAVTAGALLAWYFFKGNCNNPPQ